MLQAGSLSGNLPKWREFTNVPWILQTVSGYDLGFETTPHQVNLPKFPKFSERETALIESEIKNLISKGAVTEVSPCDNEFISTVFLVPRKTGDFRPVVNLKPLNQFVEKIHFKRKNIRMALNYISPGDFMVSIDLKDAYFSVPVFHPHRKYLRFLWNFKRYEFTCLPFGYSFAPRVFTKIFKPVLAHFRFLGFRVIIFIDDLILIASSYYERLQQLEVLKQTLCELGFTVSVEESQLVPINEILYLGFIINSIAMRLQLPAVELEKIVSACKALLAKPQPSVRDNSRSIHVRLAVDNSTAVAYINMGGVRSPLLDSLSRSMWEWCKLRGIFISAQHIPRKVNYQADTLSREISSNLEWSINGEVFQEIISQTFIPEIDLFAPRLNAKTAKFISWHPQPGALAIDVFSLSWANMNCYAFPPFSLLPRVLPKIRLDKAVVLLIAPVWPTQSWYPLLTQTELGRLDVIRKTLLNKGFFKASS